MIEMRGIEQFYGGTQILWDLSLSIGSGSCVSILGRNGVGKTTLLKSLMGLLPISAGKIILNGEDFTKKPVSSRARHGVGFVPQGRDIFPSLTVEENLQVGLKARGDRLKNIPQRVFDLFPVLYDMLKRNGGDLSGGQQQQLAIGRALVIEPNLLILDEPNEGIQPSIVKHIGEVISLLNRAEGVTVLLVEQKLAFAKRVTDEFRLMDKGSFVAAGEMSELSEHLVSRHLSV